MACGIRIVPEERHRGPQPNVPKLGSPPIEVVARTTLALPPIQHYVTTMLLHSTPTVRRPAASTLCPPTLSHSVPDDRRNAGQTRRCMRSATLPETQLSCVDADAYPKFVACEAKRLDKLPASGTAASLDLARREHCPSGVVALRTREIEDSHVGVANGLVQEGPPMPTWRSWPTKILRHVCPLRKASFSGMYRFVDCLDQLTRRKWFTQIGNASCFNGLPFHDFTVDRRHEYDWERGSPCRKPASQFNAGNATQIYIEHETACFTCGGVLKEPLG